MGRKIDKIIGVLAMLTMLGAVPLRAEEDVVQPQPLNIEAIPEVPASLAQRGGGLARRNPFSASDKLAQRAMQPKSEAQRSPDPHFTPQQSATVKLPEMKLRGHLHSHDGEMVALLQIGKGEVHIVREGDTVGLHDLGIDTVVRVKQISRLHLVIESGSLEHLIIVR